MKVCFITPLFDPWNIGGAEKYINILANFISENHNVVVITTKGPSQRDLKKTNSNFKIIELKNSNVNSYYSILKNNQSINSIRKFFCNVFDLCNLGL